MTSLLACLLSAYKEWLTRPNDAELMASPFPPPNPDITPLFIMPHDISVFAMVPQWRYELAMRAYQRWHELNKNGLTAKLKRVRLDGQEENE